MEPSEMNSLTNMMAFQLTGDGWTVEKLAAATAKDLTGYIGIGKATAAKIIQEAIDIINKQGLDDADRLAKEYYYSKAPLEKILADWEGEGLETVNVALSTAGALAKLKGIDEGLALRLISKAQDIVNQQELLKQKYEAYSGPQRVTSSAFPVEWLSGQVEPPPMAVRVRRGFEAAQREYKAQNG